MVARPCSCLGRAWDVFFGSTLGAIRAVPSLAWVPLLILGLKIGEESKITLIAIGAFFPVYTTVSAALRHVDRQLVEAGRAFGLHGVRLFGRTTDALLGVFENWAIRRWT